MNKTITHGLFTAVLCAAVSIPTTSQALSCMDPAGMTDFYVNGEEFTIFTAVAGETNEFVKQPASTDGDPNRQFNSGYTGQFVSVTDAHKGFTQSEQWVYFQKDSTWNYLCAGGPAAEGETTLYIVNDSGGDFGLTTVVNSYPADSEIAEDLLAALDDAEVSGDVFAGEPSSWASDLVREIVDMIFVIKIKISEYRFWNTQS